MSYVPFALLTAVLFLRPEELFPDLAGLRLYLLMIAVALVLAAPGVLRQLRPADLRWQPVTAGVLGLFAAGVLAHLARGRVGPAVDFAGEFGKVVLFYLLLVAVLDTRGRLDAYLGWLVVLILVAAGLGLMQHHGVIDWEALQPVEQADVDDETGEAVVYPRLRGTGIFNDPNDLCLVLGVGICCALYRGFETDNLLARLAWLAPIGAFLYALALTKSRGGLLGVGAAAVAFVFLRYGWRKGALLLVVVLPAGAALFAGRQTDVSLGAGTGQERIQLWSEGLEMLFRGNPVTGIGPGEYVEELPQVAHNSFVHAYVETGLVGGAVFLGVFALAAAALYRTGRADPAGPGMAAYLFAMTVGYAVGMFSLSRNYVVPTALILGLAAAYLNVADRDPPAWYRIDWRLARAGIVLGVFGLVGVKLFVTAFARFGEGDVPTTDLDAPPVTTTPDPWAEATRPGRRTRIAPPGRWAWVDLGELWRYRELLYFLAWRDVKVRYKQTALGAAWAVLQPALMMAVFTVFFGRLAGVPTGDDLPQPLFFLTGVVPWFFFASAVSAAAASVVGSERLVTKVYFPRLVVPFAAVGAAAVDFLVACGLLAVVAGGYAAAGYPIAPGWQLLLAPVAAALIGLFAAGVGTWLAALNVEYRDIRYVVPFFIQLGMFATPTIYMRPTGEEGGVVRFLLSVNPLTSLVESFRAGVVGGPVPWTGLGVAAVAAVAVFVTGCLYFRRAEDRFADVI